MHCPAFERLGDLFSDGGRDIERGHPGLLLIPVVVGYDGALALDPGNKGQEVIVESDGPHEADGYVSGQLVQDLFDLIMECKDTISFIGMGADAAEVDDALDARLLNGLHKSMGKAVAVLIDVEIGVEETSRGLHQVNSVGAFEGSGEENGVFNGPDGGNRAQGFDGPGLIGIAADDGDGVALPNKLFGEGLADIS